MALTAGHMAFGVTDEVGCVVGAAALPGGSGQVRGDRIDEAGVSI
jgi:hypothetical protein